MKAVFLCLDESQKHFCVKISHRNVSMFRSITEMFPGSEQSQKFFHVQITEAFPCSDQSQKSLHVKISHRRISMFRSVTEEFKCSDQ